MPKVKVESNMMYFGTKGYPKGSILEMTDDEALECLEDGNVSLAPDDAEISGGEEREFDKLDTLIQNRDYEAAKKEAAAQGIRTPDPAADPHKPEPMTGISPRDVSDLGDFGNPST